MDPLPPPQQSQIDFFILALTWPPAYCSINKCNHKPPKKQFTIHGFWPRISHGQQIDCSKISLPSSTFNKERSNLLLLWPNLTEANNNKACESFWNYEWMKHGSCSHYSASNYFAKVIELAKTYDILSMLKSEGISPGGTYITQTIKDKIKGHTNAVVELRCYAIQAGPRLLYQIAEVRLCFKNDGKTIKNCVQQQASCQSKQVLFQ
ncbi:hypothetical protein L6164_023053 [Bauhinia variegata]|uniref:Uncharacterized protein n=1 Tax=Bauhinia variegata TaxID=167791 RepID=A0ACB9MIY3_BAUVA|nr:hypothetical protein L6164_023053 [Bauhinia variegata]